MEVLTLVLGDYVARMETQWCDQERQAWWLCSLERQMHGRENGMEPTRLPPDKSGKVFQEK
jgi:hypothetical protein